MAARTQDPERRESVKSSASQLALVQSSLVDELIKQNLAGGKEYESSGKLISGLFEDLFNVGGGIAGLFGAEEGPGIGTRLFGKQKGTSDEEKVALIKAAADMAGVALTGDTQKDLANIAAAVEKFKSTTEASTALKTAETQANANKGIATINALAGQKQTETQAKAAESVAGINKSAEIGKAHIGATTELQKTDKEIAAGLKRTQMEGDTARDVAKTRGQSEVQAAGIQAAGKPVKMSDSEILAQNVDSVVGLKLGQDFTESNLVAQTLLGEFATSVQDPSYLQKIASELKKGTGPTISKLSESLRSQYAAQLEATDSVSRDQMPASVFHKLNDSLSGTLEGMLTDVSNDPNTPQEKKIAVQAAIGDSIGAYQTQAKSLETIISPLLHEALNTTLEVHGYRKRYEEIFDNVRRGADPSTAFNLRTGKGISPLNYEQARRVLEEFKEKMPDTRSDTVDEARKKYEALRKRVNEMAGREVYK